MINTIYEFGESVAAQAGMGKVKHRTFVYVLDSAQDVTIQDGFAIMLRELAGAGHQFEKVEMPSVICKNGNVYTLAHEKVYGKNGEITLQPSNVLRHALSQTFTIDTLYIDENKEMVDITHNGIRDAGNHRLEVVGDFENIAKSDPNILVECLHRRIMKGCGWGPRLNEQMSYLSPIIPPFATPPPLLLELISPKTLKSFMAHIEGYGGLYKYFTNTCGMKIAVTFDPPPFDPSKIEVKKKPSKYEGEPILHTTDTWTTNFVGAGEAATPWDNIREAEARQRDRLTADQLTRAAREHFGGTLRPLRVENPTTRIIRR
jgi:hypothetical protein